MVIAIVVVALIAGFVFQRQIGEWAFDRAAAQRITQAASDADLPDGLHLALCGTGTPLPNQDRAGPCAAVIAGGHFFVIDAGEGSARTINLMNLDLGRLDGVMLTHFHSDHIDGLGQFGILHWTLATADEPLALIGPTGVEQVAEGFNTAYAQDKVLRTRHHGESIAPSGGGGFRAVPFATPTKPTVIFEADGLRVTAFPVDHDPVRPAVGYRFDYKGRSVVISGDTDRSASLERAAKGADLLLHEALQPRLVRSMTTALEDTGDKTTAQITRDILSYHASPEEAAQSAAAAGVDQLVLTHLIPPLPSRLFYPAFLGDAAKFYDGPIVVGEDGMLFTLPPDSDEILLDRRM